MSMVDPTPAAGADVATYERLHASHRAQLADLNEHDPASPVYKRPDVAAQYRERLEQEFQATLARHGIEPPQLKTPEEIREERFAESWHMELVTPALADELDSQREQEEALTPYARELRVADLKKEFGAQYDQLVADARLGLKPGEAFPDAVLSNKFLLLNLAALGRHAQAYGRARTAAKL